MVWLKPYPDTEPDAEPATEPDSELDTEPDMNVAGLRSAAWDPNWILLFGGSEHPAGDVASSVSTVWGIVDIASADEFIQRCKALRADWRWVASSITT